MGEPPKDWPYLAFLAYPSVPAQYSYSWAVKDDYSGNDFGQNEERNDDLTTGAYYVNLHRL